MAWETGQLWLAPGATEDRWVAWGDPGPWQGVQFTLARMIEVGRVDVQSRGVELERFAPQPDFVYWTTLVNRSSANWALFALAGGGVV
ncbi:hypothetical protein [Actinophytocola sp.]|jgi:hypothetical protein|uniref:hypothetical protein n=1 Tax=Actinophytocola sp. TaxID=1872138 RepID=UPI002D71A630|nr:hypothetical protein [Actinophytocola sp.]HYQ65017.1 hypothetical protein [Actinophytocola sp.]